MASKANDFDESHITPYKKRTMQEGTGSDSDYESEDEGLQLIIKENIQWTGCQKKTPVILFNPEAFLNKRGNHKTVGERYHMAYKTDCQIVRTILNFHGFQEAESKSPDFNVIWIGAHLKAFTLHSMTEFQKINHFPRSYELTRKDNLYKNLQKMQQLKGFKNFDIIPPSFVLPSEYHNFCSAFLKNKGPWIVKPVASSRGRGVFLVNHELGTCPIKDIKYQDQYCGSLQPEQIPLDDNIVVCKYISNPLLIDGLKFDVRLYVAVTSYDPLIIYLYEEGLTRFATMKYDWSPQHLNNQFMHLTNYSVNKNNEDYVKNDDAEVEDYGNKWSLGALLRYLRSNGKDTVALMMTIEDVIIKTILSVELPIATACKMFISHRGNCFELYGFDILIDENMKPWVLEVNMSPSLACDSPLDLKIKSHMICDLLTLAGIICHDPMMRTHQNSKCSMEVKTKMGAAIKKKRPQATSSTASERKGKKQDRKINSSGKDKASLKGEEIKVLRMVEEENQRKGGWVRIYPTVDSWDLYSMFHQYSTTHNMMIHQNLFPERHKNSVLLPKSTTASNASVGNRARSAYIQLNSNSHRTDAEMAASCTEVLLRTKQYERKLGTNGGRRRENERKKLVQDVGDESEGGEDENEDGEVNEDEIESQNGKKNDTNMSLSTKVQARSAFAMYLVRVQQRLITDGPQMSQDDMDGLNEQMNAMIENLESECSGLREENFKLKMKVDMQHQALAFAKVKKGNFSTDEHQRSMSEERNAESGTLDIELAKAFRDFFRDIKPVQQQIKDMKSQVPLLQSGEQNDNLISTLMSQEKSLDIVDEKLSDCVNSLRKSVATSLKKQKEKN